MINFAALADRSKYVKGGRSRPQVLAVATAEQKNKENDDRDDQQGIFRQTTEVAQSATAVSLSTAAAASI